MATKQSTVDFLCEQLIEVGEIRYKKMFGEYALYCDNKVVALVCDDRLYIKPTNVGYSFLDKSHEASPYPGAKNYLLVPEEQWDDRDWLSDFIKQTAMVLPLPTNKKKKNKTY